MNLQPILSLSKACLRYVFRMLLAGFSQEKLWVLRAVINLFIVIFFILIEVYNLLFNLIVLRPCLSRRLHILFTRSLASLESTGFRSFDDLRLLYCLPASQVAAVVVLCCCSLVGAVCRDSYPSAVEGNLI
jgi:hypothetical protein